MGEAAHLTGLHGGFGLFWEELKFLESQGYKLVRKLGEGDTRNVFLAQYSKDDFAQLRVLNIPKDVLNQDSPTTRINFDRGDLNRRELLSASALIHPHIITLLDTFQFNGKTINVEEYFEAESLEGVVFNDRKRFENVFSQASDAVCYMHSDRRYLHRDIKLSNILVNEKSLAKLDDLQNSAPLDAIEELLLPTRGATQNAHPGVLNDFMQGIPTRCTEKTDVYALACSMYKAITGNDAFSYRLRFDAEGRDGDRKISLINRREHERTLNNALKKLPRWARRYKDLLRSGMTLGEEGYNKHHPVAEFREDFKYASKDNVWDRLKEPVVRYVGVSLIALAGLIGYAFQEVLRDAETKFTHLTEESKQYPVGALWDGESLEIGNNYVGLEVDAHRIGDLNQDSKKGVLCVNQGDTLRIGVSCHEHAIANRNGFQGPFIEGKIYFEGHPGKEFVVDAFPYNGAVSYYSEGYFHGSFSDKLIVPKDMEDGVRFLIAEFYAPEKDFNGLKFLQPGKVMNRGVLPVVVGAPRDTLLVNYVLLTDYDQVHFKNVHGFVPWFSNSLVYTAAIPEEGFVHAENSFERGRSDSRFGMRLPAARNETEKILKIGVLSGGRNVFETYLPIKGKPIGDNYRWDFAIPDRDFSKKLEMMRLKY